MGGAARRGKRDEDVASDGNWLFPLLAGLEIIATIAYPTSSVCCPR